MVMRRVAIPLRNVLDERKAFLGVVPASEDDGKPSRSVVSGPRVSFISGSLSLQTTADSEREDRGYYIGKYEITEIQYEIFMRGLLTPDGSHADVKDPACVPIVEKAAAVRNTLVLPATRVTWFDAVEFARAYTEWLIARDRERILAGKDPNALPWVESTPAFLRLPTAAEWEFAARGGEVDPATQTTRTYQILVDGARRPGTLEEIASLTTVDNPPVDGAEVHYAGRKLPNTFGLYDMIGNASEVVLDLFQPRRPDQLSSALGAFVQMGGSASDQGSAIGVGARVEIPMFRREGTVRSPVAGFRLLLSAPFQVNKRQGRWEEAAGNPDFDKKIEQAYLALVRSGAPGEAESDTVRISLEQAKKELESRTNEGESCQSRIDQILPELESAKASLERSRAAVSQREADLQVERIRSLVLTASNINAVTRQIASAAPAIDEAKSQLQTLTDESLKQRLTAKIQEAEYRRRQLEGSNEASFNYYVDTVVGLSTARQESVESSRTIVEQQFATIGDTVFNAFQPVVRAHLTAARSFPGRGPDQSVKAAWLQEIQKTQRTRATN